MEVIMQQKPGDQELIITNSVTNLQPEKPKKVKKSPIEHVEFQTYGHYSIENNPEQKPRTTLKQLGSVGGGFMGSVQRK